jgi:hypothetical protein
MNGSISARTPFRGKAILTQKPVHPERVEGPFFFLKHTQPSKKPQPFDKLRVDGVGFLGRFTNPTLAMIAKSAPKGPIHD